MGSTNILSSNTEFSKNALQNSPSHYAKNHRMPRTKIDYTHDTCQKNDKKVAQVESNVFTKLALGNCMENLMKTSSHSLPKQLFTVNVNKVDDSSSGNNSSVGASIPHKSVENLKREESSGIPIPPRRNNHNIGDHSSRYSSIISSPPSGRFTPNNFMFGSPTKASSPVQSGYLDICASGSIGSGKISRPQPISVSVGGATSCGDYRLGLVFIHLLFVIFSCCCCFFFLIFLWLNTYFY